MRRRARILTDGSPPCALAVAAIADTALTRMVGLLGRASLDHGDGLLLRPCGMVHTWFMRFPIDVLFLNDEGVVLRSVDTLRPFRMAWGGWSATITLELPAGTVRQARVAPGTRLRVEVA